MRALRGGRSRSREKRGAGAKATTWGAPAHLVNRATCRLCGGAFFVILLICPKCRGQVEESYEDGLCCTECWRTGEPVRVELDLDEPADVIRRKVDSLVALERFKLAQVEREDEFRQAERDWYENLSVADRFWEDSRRKRVRREELAAMRPLDRAFSSMMDMWRPGLIRQLYTDSPLLDLLNERGPPADALDTWLAQDGAMPEIDVALGLAEPMPRPFDEPGLMVSVHAGSVN